MIESGVRTLMTALGNPGIHWRVLVMFWEAWAITTQFDALACIIYALTSAGVFADLLIPRQRITCSAATPVVGSPEDTLPLDYRTPANMYWVNIWSSNCGQLVRDLNQLTSRDLAHSVCKSWWSWRRMNETIPIHFAPSYWLRVRQTEIRWPF